MCSACPRAPAAQPPRSAARRCRLDPTSRVGLAGPRAAPCSRSRSERPPWPRPAAAPAPPLPCPAGVCVRGGHASRSGAGVGARGDCRTCRAATWRADLAMGGRVMKYRLPSARAQRYIWPLLWLSTCRWTWARIMTLPPMARRTTRRSGRRSRRPHPWPAPDAAARGPPSAPPPAAVHPARQRARAQGPLPAAAPPSYYRGFKPTTRLRPEK